MYAAYLLLFFGAFLLSANWAIGAGGIGVSLADEEQRLAYRETTGAFLPRLRRMMPARVRPARAGAGCGGR